MRLGSGVQRGGSSPTALCFRADDFLGGWGARIIRPGRASPLRGRPSGVQTTEYLARMATTVDKQVGPDDRARRASPVGTGLGLLDQRVATDGQLARVELHAVDRELHVGQWRRSLTCRGVRHELFVLEEVHPAAVGQLAAEHGMAISGYSTSVNWAASAILEFTYLEMILGSGMTPQQAAEQVQLLLPFAGDSEVPGGAFAPAGFRIVG